MKRITASFSGLFNYWPLRTKLVLSYLILIIIPVFILVHISYLNIHRSVVHQTGNAYLEALKQAEKNISFGLAAAHNIADLAQTNDEIQRVLRVLEERPPGKGEVIDFFNLLNRNVILFEGKENVLQVNFFLKGSAAFISADSNFSSLQELKLELAMGPLLTRERRQLWLYAGELLHLQSSKPDSVIFFKEIRDLNNIQQTLGYIMVEMDSRFIWEHIRDIRLPDGAEAIAYKGDDRLGLSNLLAGELRLSETFMAGDTAGRSGVYPFGPANDKLYAMIHGIDGLDWKLALLMTEEHLGMNSKQIQSFMLFLAAIVTLLAVITAYFLSGTITKRLKKLIRLIKHAERGKFETEADVRGTDEYAVLLKSFNKMSVTIHTLIKEVYEAKISKQETEMKLLYAQINPHFLYNTLDIIQWKALRIHAADIAEVAEALAKFLRLSLNDGKEHITLAEEFEETKQYMKIINVRYRNAIELHTEIEAGLEERVVLKMILQPLVENAVVHGIRPKPGRSGNVTIRASVEGEFVLIEVADDGVGFAAEKLKQALVHEGRGYGLKNVHKRIQVYYGPECGLSFCSEPGQGSKVRVKLKN